MPSLYRVSMLLSLCCCDCPRPCAGKPRLQLGTSRSPGCSGAVGLRGRPWETSTSLCTFRIWCPLCVNPVPPVMHPTPISCASGSRARALLPLVKPGAWGRPTCLLGAWVDSNLVPGHVAQSVNEQRARVLWPAELRAGSRGRGGVRDRSPARVRRVPCLPVTPASWTTLGFCQDGLSSHPSPLPLCPPGRKQTDPGSAEARLAGGLAG